MWETMVIHVQYVHDGRIENCRPFRSWTTPAVGYEVRALLLVVAEAVWYPSSSGWP